jgi:DNA invertase Pin-like site-specific DNA recombinase
MTIAAIYARKSTEQAVSDDAKSVTRQVVQGKAFAESKGWSVAEHVYVDDAKSGAEFENRPGLQAMLATLKPKPPFQVLMASEESRVGRESLETGYILKRLLMSGVKIWTYLDAKEITIANSTDKVVRSVKSFASEVKREQAQKRVFDSLSVKARNGYAVGSMIYGYSHVRTDEPNRTLRDGPRSRRSASHGGTSGDDFYRESQPGPRD